MADTERLRIRPLGRHDVRDDELAARLGELSANAAGVFAQLEALAPQLDEQIAAGIAQLQQQVATAITSVEQAICSLGDRSLGELGGLGSLFGLDGLIPGFDGELPGLGELFPGLDGASTGGPLTGLLDELCARP